MSEKQDRYTKSCTARRTARILVLLAAAAFLLVMTVMAHAPSDIVMSYDPGSEKLSVTITHAVADPQTHYVRKVQVKQNDRVISDPDYTSQPTKDTFTYTYDVRANSGDTFRVIATCSLAGNLEKVYDVPAPATAATAAPAAPPQTPAVPDTPAIPAPTQKSATGLVPVLGAVAFLLMRKE